MQGACRFIQPILFKYLIGYFSDEPTISRDTALIYAGGIALSSVIQACVGPQVVYWLIRSGMRWQTGTVDLVYRKVSLE